MRDLLTTLRTRFFTDVAKISPKFYGRFIILTHLLPDRPELLSVLSTIAPISLIIAIPYSLDTNTLDSLQNDYLILTPTLDELFNPDYLSSVLANELEKGPRILLEIGGYFAFILQTIPLHIRNNLLGVIEDTEAGHRQYQQTSELPFPVISVARSTLKATEDFLVGNSCLFSTEKLLRQAGFLIEGKKSLVLGYGKVGRGLADALSRRDCPVSVYDIDPIRRILALSEGFHIPEKSVAIQNAEIIFGTTGENSLSSYDITRVKNGSILVSCSSKNHEFDLNFLEKNYNKEEVFPHFERYRNKNHTFYILSKGTPINFIDGAVIGPILALTQAEMILAIRKLLLEERKSGIFELCEEERQMLATLWLKHFCDSTTGYYRHDATNAY